MVGFIIWLTAAKIPKYRFIQGIVSNFRLKANVESNSDGCGNSPVVVNAMSWPDHTTDLILFRQPDKARQQIF